MRVADGRGPVRRTIVLLVAFAVLFVTEGFGLAADTAGLGKGMVKVGYAVG